jgi:hypothetical protein
MTTASLPLARSDLQFAPLLLRGERYWTVKDPIARRYYQLREEEYFLLQLLDGQKSHDEIVRLFEARFAPRRLRRGDLVGFVGMLHREGLTVASALGQSEHLLAQRDRRRRQRWLALATNVLAIRLPGINPNRWLERVVPRLAWLVSPVCGVLYVVLLVSALLLVCSQFDALAARLPRFRDFFSGENLLWLAVSLALVKSLHELGHAFACKYFGGECNRAVLRCFGRLALAQTVAADCRERRRNDRGAWAGRGRNLAVGDNQPGVVELARPQCDVRLLGGDACDQRQSVVAVRWLLHVC